MDRVFWVKVWQINAARSADRRLATTGKLRFRAVPPHYTSSDCPECGKRVKKSLSTRTHVCNCGIPILDRDYAASLNILKKATIGHIGSWSNDILDLNAWGDPTSILVGSNACQSKSDR